MAGSQCAATQLEPNDGKAITPIRHVIIVIGENRSFDHVFGAYVPKPCQSVFNILSEGIVTKDGSPRRLALATTQSGPSYWTARAVLA